MHSISEVGTNVPAFLGKLWKLVEDPMTNDLISWSSLGDSFVIKDGTRLARELLPMYYKHNNMASFIRQLNMYGFHKIVSSDCKQDTEEMKFIHSYFIRGHPYLLEKIKRKVANITVARGPEKPDIVNKMWNDVRQMKGKQDSMDSKLMAMKRENEALWRELSHMRQRHKKQQNIVNKLIQYLVILIQSNHLPVTRRGFPLMLRDKSGHCSSVNQSSKSPTGPTIHELDSADVLLEDEDCSTAEPMVSSSDTIPELFSPEVDIDRVDDVEEKDDSAIQITDSDFPEHFLTVGGKTIPINIQDFPNLSKAEEGLLEDDVPLAATKAQPKTKKRLGRSTTNIPAKRQKKESTSFQFVVRKTENDKFVVQPETYNTPLQKKTLFPISDIDIGAPLQQSPTPPPVNVSQDWTSPPSPVLPPSKDKLIGTPIVEGFLSSGMAETVPSESTIDTLSCGVTDPVLNNMQVACMDNGKSGLNRLGHLEEMDNHVESVQADLDSFKELLKSEGISLDANTLLGLLNEDGNMPQYLFTNPAADDCMNKQKETEGNELTMYNQSIFDLSDIINGNDWSILDTDDTQLVSQDNVFKEIGLNTPQFLDSSPSFPTPSKIKKK